MTSIRLNLLVVNIFIPANCQPGFTQMQLRLFLTSSSLPRSILLSFKELLTTLVIGSDVKVPALTMENYLAGECTYSYAPMSGSPIIGFPWIS